MKQSSMADDFKLTSPEIIPSGHGGRRPGAGRRRGTINRLRDKLSEGSWKAGAREHPEVLAGILKRAKKLNDPLWTPNKTDAMLAVWVAEHYWPIPRSAPVQIDLRSASSMQDALAAGDLTPGDYSALVRANDQYPASGRLVANTINARELLTERLARVIEERNHRNGFHNVSSGEQSAIGQSDCSTESAAPGSPDEPIETRVERALHDAIERGDVAALESIAGELDQK
jgi:hypothetical protein